MKKIFTAIFATVALCSCNLDLAPENVMVDQNVYMESKTTQAALLGAYTRMNIFLGGAPEDQNNYAYYSYCMLAGDLGTDNFKVRADGMSAFIALENCEYTNSERDGAILDAWVKGYNAIDYANNVIDGVRRYAEYDESLQKQYIAEARFLRGLVYLNMLKMFGDGALTGRGDGLGLILRDTPYDGYNPDLVKTRSTNDATWDFIFEDLLAAEADLPEAAGLPETRVRATKPVVWALLSRAYLYRGSYNNDETMLSEAARYAGKVLDCPDYTFSTLYSDHIRNIFPQNIYDSTSAVEYPDPSARSEEIIFFQPSRISTEKYCNGMGQYYYNKRFLYVEKTFYSELYLPGDLRGYVEGSPYSMIGIGGTNYYASDLTTLKYTNAAGYDDVIFLRLSEIKLNYAEALARKDGINAESLKHLNDIRCKAFAPEDRPAELTGPDFASKEAFIDEILVERNRELAFEGHRRWDLIRCGKPLRTEGIPDGRKILPIPDYEVNISKGKIKQNSAFE